MDFNEYQKLAARTAVNNERRPTEQMRLCNFALGLTGEAGEVADVIKKYVFHGKVMNVQDFNKELGDTLWYLTMLCEAMGTTLEQVATWNIEKLRKRYPNGFNEADSANRVDTPSEDA